MISRRLTSTSRRKAQEVKEFTHIIVGAGGYDKLINQHVSSTHKKRRCSSSVCVTNELHVAAQLVKCCWKAKLQPKI